MTGTAATTPVLARFEHDRIGHRRTDEAWVAQAWADPLTRVLVLSADGKVQTAGTSDIADASRTAGLALRWLTPAAATALTSGTGLRLLLGEHGGTAYFAVLATHQLASADWRNLRSVAVQLNALESGILTAAVAVQAWHASHTHCPRCGAETEPIQSGWASRCTADGSQHFPRTDPAVIMLITDDAGRCLLGRNAAWPSGRFSTLAGFVEAGESAEAAVAREVAEEVGVAVTDIRYFASQPHPFPGSLMLGYTARLAGSPVIKLDEVEIAEAGWFTREEVRRAVNWDELEPGKPSSDLPALRALPPGMSIARQLIETWLVAD